MSETNTAGNDQVITARHARRGNQVRIYLRKQFRFFIYESDWKFLPMAAIIALLVALVIRNKFFVNMEGCLIGAFALTCVGIWNGCFNSIQSVCRERGIIKREHRSGMHISSYMTAHMIYQFFLCLAQTVLTMFCLLLMGVPIPEKGFITPWMVLDIGITMLLITYASDMMSLFLSSISHTTTGAMTVMPFILIFQLVFSGGIIPLPAWSQVLSDFTISNYGIKALATQSDYNNQPMVAAWKTLSGMRDSEIGGTFTVQQLLDALGSPGLEPYRDIQVFRPYTVGEVSEILTSGDEYLQLREKKINTPVTARELLNTLLTDDRYQDIRAKDSGIPGLTLGGALTALLENPDLAEVLDAEIGRSITVGQVLDALQAEETADANADTQLNEPVTLGDLTDFLVNNQSLKEQGDREITLKTTMGALIDLFGEENVKQIVEKKTAEAAYDPAYEHTPENILHNWLMIGIFIAFFSIAATVVLELIDKDKR